MEIICPVCKGENKFTIKTLFKERCACCNGNYVEHYTTKIKIARVSAQVLVQGFMIASIFRKSFSFVLGFLLYMVIEYFCLKTLNK